MTQLDTAIKGELSDGLRGTYKPSAELTKENRRALGKWLEKGFTIRKRRISKGQSLWRRRRRKSSKTFRRIRYIKKS